jgi:hypothetical protein
MGNELGWDNRVQTSNNIFLVLALYVEREKFPQDIIIEIEKDTD